MALPRLTGVVERMDLPEVDPSELAQTLTDLAWINRVFGGTRAVLDHLHPLISTLSPPVALLDVGTGYADIPRSIVRWARKGGVPVRIVAVDHHDGIRAQAASACLPYPEIRLAEADALSLPFPDRSIDVVIASQLLHHMEEEQPVLLLRELRRVARSAVVVSDLRRGFWPYLVTWSALRLVSTSALIRHDGPLSIRRSFLPTELMGLAKAAGWRRPEVSPHPFFRLVLTERIG